MGWCCIHKLLVKERAFTLLQIKRGRGLGFPTFFPSSRPERLKPALPAIPNLGDARQVWLLWCSVCAGRNPGTLGSSRTTNLRCDHRRQVLDQPIRLVRLQLLQRRAAGCDDQRSGSDRAGALDVARGVADDKNLLAVQIVVQQSAAAFFGEGGDLIAVL